MNLLEVALEIPRDANLVFGQAHFIKTVEDLAEIVVTTVPGAKFGLAFCEASGPCLIRTEGNDPELVAAARRICGCGASRSRASGGSRTTSSGSP